MYFVTNENREPILSPTGEFYECLSVHEAFALVASMGGGYVVDSEDGSFVWPPPSPVARTWEESL